MGLPISEEGDEDHQQVENDSKWRHDSEEDHGAPAAEARASGDENGEESLEEMARKALECPCVAELRDGPCGKQFSEAFICYVKSKAEEKGSDCIEPFLAMQACMSASPELFSKYDTDDATDSGAGELPIQRRPSRKSKPPSPRPAAPPVPAPTSAPD